MFPAPIPENELERLASLKALQILDTAAEPRFDRLTRIASALFQVPIALVSLIDADRQWFKSRQGLQPQQTSRDISFCGHAILQSRPMIIPDALADPRFVDNPLVTGAPFIRFYAGMPLQAPDGQRIGTLCIIDTQPRTLSDEQIAQLADLASTVEDEIARKYVSGIATQFREQQDRLRAILNTVNEGIAVTNAEGKILMSNPTLCELFDFTLNELAGRHVQTLLDRPLNCVLTQIIDNHVAHGDDHHARANNIFEVNGKTSNGTCFPLELTIRAMCVNGSSQCVFLFRDLTDHKRELADQSKREYFLQTIADQTPGMIGYWNKELRCAFSNHEYFTWFGRTAEQMEGIHIRDLLGEALYQKNAHFIAAALRGEPQQFERAITKPNGEVGYTLARYIPHVVDNDVLGFFVLVSDITPIKKVHDQLVLAEAQNRAMICAIPDTIMTLRPDGEILAFHGANPATPDTSIQPPSQNKLDDLLPAAVTKDIINAIQRAAKFRQVQEVSYSLLNGDGRQRHYEARVAPSDTDQSVALLRDVTDRELDRRNREFYMTQLSQQLQFSESELREREQALALAADAANLGAWTMDIRRNLFLPSEQWCRLFGFPITKELDIESKLFRVHVEEVDSARQALHDAIATSGLYEHTHRIVLPDGQIRWIFSRGRVQFDHACQAVFVRGVSVDITKRKQDELEIEQKRKEVTYLSRIAVLGELSGALAHELNQPLTSILSNAQAAQRFLNRDPVDVPELREILSEIIDEDKRAGAVIARLRHLFKQGQPTQQSIEINTLISDVCRILRNELLNHGVTLQVVLTKDPVVIDTDQVQLQQVLTNLIINACDAMDLLEPVQRIMTLRAGIVSDQYVQVSVVDRGPGIAGDTIEQIFEPFFSTKERGMGLGLSICRKIIAANGGRLWAENNPERGASLHFTLPMSRATA